MRYPFANILKGLTAAAAIAVIAGLASAPAQAEDPGMGVTVSPARATWDTGAFQTEIYIRALEELGYTVERPKQLTNEVFYQAVSQGDVHFWVNGWFPLHNDKREIFERGAQTVGYVARGGALQGYLVDRATAERLEITNLEDFKREEVKQAFDTDGDGKAEMVACPPGWGCEEVISHHLDVYDLRDHVDPIKAEYSASMADAIARFESGEPVFFYTWTPNWTVGTLTPGEDVVWIEVPFPSLPAGQEQYEDSTTVEGVAGCVNDPCAMGWPANDIRAVVNNEFLENNPAAKRLFEIVEIPLGDIFAQNARMHAGEDSEADIRRHAAEWIEENRDLFDGWVQEARAADGN